MSDSEDTSSVLAVDGVTRSKLREAARFVAPDEGTKPRKARPWVTVAALGLSWGVLSFAGGIVWDAGGMAGTLRDVDKRVGEVQAELRGMGQAIDRQNGRIDLLALSVKHETERRVELAELVDRVAYTQGNLAKYYSTLRQQMDVLWTDENLPRMKGDP